MVSRLVQILIRASGWTIGWTDGRRWSDGQTVGRIGTQYYARVVFLSLHERVNNLPRTALRQVRLTAMAIAMTNPTPRAHVYAVSPKLHVRLLICLLMARALQTVRKMYLQPCARTVKYHLDRWTPQACAHRV